MEARALHRRAAHHTRAMPESARPFRKPGRHRERRRRAWRSLPPARLLRAPAQIAATSSRARRPFEYRRRLRRTARKDLVAARGQARREADVVKSCVCGGSSIGQLGCGFELRQIAGWLEEGAPPGSSAPTTKTKAR